jgi:Holliday junction resolvase
MRDLLAQRLKQGMDAKKARLQESATSAKSQMRESSVRRAIVSALRKRGALVIALHGSVYQMRGLPDLLVCGMGKTLFMEIKTPTSLRLSKSQKVVQRTLSDYGQAVAIATSALEAVRIAELSEVILPPRGNTNISQIEFRKKCATGLRAARSRAKLSQRALSRRSQVGLVTIRGYEHGHVETSETDVVKLSVVLDVTIAEILGRSPIHA